VTAGLCQRAVGLDRKDPFDFGRACHARWNRSFEPNRRFDLFPVNFGCLYVE
jgi:hypothetical protein